MTISNVLIVDDEEMMRTLLVRCFQLGHPSWQVTTATNGQEALRQLQNRTFDLVVVDHQMPIMHGLDLGRLARKLFPGMKLVLITGSPSEAASQALEQGVFDGYLEKPFTPNQLLTLVSYIEAEQQVIH
jgi:CheY-like chemotaxis protein